MNSEDAAPQTKSMHESLCSRTRAGPEIARSFVFPGVGEQRAPSARELNHAGPPNGRQIEANITINPSFLSRADTARQPFRIRGCDAIGKKKVGRIT